MFKRRQQKFANMSCISLSFFLLFCVSHGSHMPCTYARVNFSRIARMAVTYYMYNCTSDWLEKACVLKKSIEALVLYRLSPILFTNFTKFSRIFCISQTLTFHNEFPYKKIKNSERSCFCFAPQERSIEHSTDFLVKLQRCAPKTVLYSRSVHPKLYCTAEVCTQNCIVQQRCAPKTVLYNRGVHPKQLFVNGVLFLEIVKVLNIFKSSAIKCVYIVADTTWL